MKLTYKLKRLFTKKPVKKEPPEFQYPASRSLRKYRIVERESQFCLSRKFIIQVQVFNKGVQIYFPIDLSGNPVIKNDDSEFRITMPEFSNLESATKEVERLKKDPEIIYHYFPPVPKPEVNAKLISAAPEMLDALLEALAALQMLGGAKEPPTEFVPTEVLAYRAVLSAIKKATE